MTPLIELRNVSKRFPGVVALNGVSVAVQEGACHALVGENGAGKSTLGKILAGIYAADGGEVVLEGLPVRFHNPADAVEAGIGMVHQEILFCENLSVAENLCLGDTPRRGPFVTYPDLFSRAQEALDRIGASVDPRARLGSLPIAQQQLVQIAAAVARGAKVLIFDEPTSSLSHSESERLFELIGQLRASGVTCIYVSHRLEEIFRLCEAVTVLRDGEVVSTESIKAFTPDSLVKAMIGRSLDLSSVEMPPAGEEALRVEGFSSPGKFEDVSFSLREGEILAFAGLVGSGRTEVAEAIFGLDPSATGRVCVHGKVLRSDSPRAAIDRRVGLVPEDRKHHGLVLGMGVRENMTLTILGRFAGLLGMVHRREERREASRYFERLRVRAPGLETVTSGLSGGNQQKVVIAKWVAAQCDVLMVDEPTRGVDVGAKGEIHDILREIALAGKAVLMISSELPEVLKLATRIVVFRHGRVVGEVPRSEASEEVLIKLMTGV